jgi:polar amino acid transport system substrate-binding protein
MPPGTACHHAVAKDHGTQQKIACSAHAHDQTTGDDMAYACTLLFVFIGLTCSAVAQPVKICDDSREWPPYSYFPRTHGKIDRSQLTGAMIELTQHIFHLMQMDYTITAMPWKRCLHEVAHFKKLGDYEVAIEGTLSEERLQQYYASTYVYTTTGGYWYSTRQYPQGPAIQTPADLKQYSLCGIQGHNYTGYGITPDLIRNRPSTYQSALDMVSKGRCNLFLSNLPIPLGKAKLGELTIPEDVVGKKVPHLSSGTFHMFIAKGSPRAYELSTKINQAIHLLSLRGTTHKIFDKYLPTCGRHC